MRGFARIMGVLLVSTLSLSACLSTYYLAPVEKEPFLTERTIYIVLDDGSELKLKRCVLLEDVLIGITMGNQQVQVELSRIRLAYYKKIKPGVPYLAGFSAGAVGVAVWLIAGAFAAPD